MRIEESKTTPCSRSPVKLKSNLVVHEPATDTWIPCFIGIECSDGAVSAFLEVFIKLEFIFMKLDSTLQIVKSLDGENCSC